MKLLAVLLALAAIVAFSVPPSLAGPSSSDGPKNSHAVAMKAKWDGLSESKKAKALAKAESHKLFSKWNYSSDGTATGRFLSFHWASSISTLHNYTVKDGTNSTLMFDSIVFSTQPPDVLNDGPTATGSVLHIHGNKTAILVHNNPTATLKAKAGNETLWVNFTVPAGATLNATGKEVKVTIGSIHGHILTNGKDNLTVSGNLVTAHLGANEKAMFRAHPALAGPTASLHESNAAFKSGKLGAVVHLVDADGTPVSDDESIDVDTTVKEIRKGRIALDADAKVTGSRCVFILSSDEYFRMDSSGNLGSDVVVKIAGVAVVKVSKASDVCTSANATAFLSHADGTVLMVANFAHFSAQTLTVEQASAQETSGAAESPGGAASSSRAPGLGLAALLVGLGAAILVGRRR